MEGVTVIHQFQPSRDEGGRGRVQCGDGLRFKGGFFKGRRTENDLDISGKQ